MIGQCEMRALEGESDIQEEGGTEGGRGREEGRERQRECGVLAVREQVSATTGPSCRCTGQRWCRL